MARAYSYIDICRNEDDLIAKGLTLLELTGETQLLENLREEVRKIPLGNPSGIFLI